MKIGFVWLPLSVFVFIAITYLHCSSCVSNILPHPLHPEILSSYLFSPISFLFHPFHNQKKMTAILVQWRNLERHLHRPDQVIILSYLTVNKSSHSSIIKSNDRFSLISRSSPILSTVLPSRSLYFRLSRSPFSLPTSAILYYII